jgi:hypothetical protein
VPIGARTSRPASREAEKRYYTYQFGSHLRTVGLAVFDKILIRTILQPYWRLIRSQTLGVQCIVIQDRREILLVRHSYVRGWHLPGGGVERHENLEQALERELLEEAGLGIRGTPKLHGIFSNFERFKGDHIAVYIVNDWEYPRPLSKV